MQNHHNNNSGESTSYWMEIDFPEFPPLEKDLDCDVAIVGAGIVGLTCAYKLSKLGKKVVVLDQGAIAGGQTARTTAHLTWVLDDRFSDLEKLFGLEGAKLAAESHAAAIDEIEKIVWDEMIACDFERVNGYLFVPPEDSFEVLEKEFEVLQRMNRDVKKVNKAPISSFNTGAALQFTNQAEFHVLKYLKGVVQAVVKNGGKIFANTHVGHIEEGEPCILETSNGFKVTCRDLIVATCTPVNNRYMIHTKQSAYRTYVIGGLIPHGVIGKALFWDTPDPYHYIRVIKNEKHPEYDWILIGGEDHRTGQDKAIDEKYEHLEEWARYRLPALGKIEYKWSGQVFEPVDSLAFIGRNPHSEHVYIATGDSGNGLTHGTIAGILITDLIMGKSNPWEELYKPSRKTLSAITEYTEENLNTAVQYLDLLTPGEEIAIDQLSPDEGVILREGVKKIAVYKDKENNVHVCSAICPHLKGCVRWNSGEKSWDCPCHGSRFDGDGRVITGPAISDLEKIQQQELSHSK